MPLRRWCRQDHERWCPPGRAPSRCRREGVDEHLRPRRRRRLGPVQRPAHLLSDRQRRHDMVELHGVGRPARCGVHQRHERVGRGERVPGHQLHHPDEHASTRRPTRARHGIRATTAEEELFAVAAPDATDVVAGGSASPQYSAVPGTRNADREHGRRRHVLEHGRAPRRLQAGSPTSHSRPPSMDGRPSPTSPPPQATHPPSLRLRTGAAAGRPSWRRASPSSPATAPATCSASATRPSRARACWVTRATRSWVRPVARPSRHAIRT